MLFFNRILICADGKLHPLLLNVSQHVKVTSNFVPLRTFFFKKPQNERQNINRSAEDEFKFEPIKGYDDDSFMDRLKYTLTHPERMKAVSKHFVKQFSQFYEEQAQEFRNGMSIRMDDKKDRIDMLFKFETTEDLNKFVVNTDSSYLMGYSSASLTLTEEKTALFSGNLCTEVPKDGNIAEAGYANILTKKNKLAFNRTRNFDWTDYSHLVFKIRGDGRSYLIVLNLQSDYLETNYVAYAHALYTRGGPYWQIAKIPFSHFYIMRKGHMLDVQRGPIPLNLIQRFGITTAGTEGPFKLEIDYIGLEFKEYFNDTSPYEEYKHNL